MLVEVIFSAQGNPVGGMSGPYIIAFVSPDELSQYPRLIEHDRQHLYLGVITDSEVCEIITDTDGDSIGLDLLLPFLKLPPKDGMFHIEAQLIMRQHWDESLTSEVLRAVQELYGYETFCSICL